MDYLLINSFIPEIFFSIFLMVFLLFNAIITSDFRRNYPILHLELLSQCLFALICLACLLQNNNSFVFIENHIFLNDFSAQIVKMIIVFFSIVSLFPILRAFKIQKLNSFEYFFYYLVSVFASLLIVNSSNLLSVYLLIELQSLSFYILASFRRDSVFSTEAGLKYFIFGSYMGGIFLLGCFILYGTLGTVNFISLESIIPFLSKTEENTLLIVLTIISLYFILFFFFFKIAIVPFHNWFPDVYEGAPVASTLIFSIIPKLSVIYILFKWLLLINIFPFVKLTLDIGGSLTVIFGVLFALQQKRVKRFVIYSSLTQMGFLLISLSILTLESVIVTYFFLVIYLLTVYLLWFTLILFYNFKVQIFEFHRSTKIVPMALTDLSYFFFIQPVWSIVFLPIFFSLMGLPPLIGFYSKIFLILNIVQAEDLVDAFLLIFVSIISGYYYLRLVKIILFEDFIFKKPSIHFAVLIYDSLFFYECLLISTLVLFLFILFFQFSTLFLFIDFIGYYFSFT